MEAEDLRKLRIAHRLTPRELAGLLHVSSEEVLCWEALEGTPSHSEIGPEIRRRILRELAVIRSLERERELVAAARSHAKRLPAQPFVPVLIRR